MGFAQARPNNMYTEYASVFSFLFRLSTLNLFRFSLLGMYVYNGRVSTTFALAENFTFELMVYAYTVIYIYIQSHIYYIEKSCRLHD